MQKLATVLVLLLCVSGAVTFSASAQESDWLYTYTTLNGTIYAVDPLNPEQHEVLFSVPSYGEELQSIDRIRLSPSREHMLIVYEDYFVQSANLKLVEVETGSVVDLFSTTLPIKAIAWSPDSRYFAFSTYNDDRWANALYLYDTLSNTLLPLTVEGEIVFDFAWSPSGNEIAFYSYPESNLRCDDCPQYIRVYSLDAETSRQVADVTQFPTIPDIMYTTFVCSMKWSPDGAFLAFLVDCPDSYQYLPFHYEVYVVNMTTGAGRSMIGTP